MQVNTVVSQTIRPETLCCNALWVLFNYNHIIVACDGCVPKLYDVVRSKIKKGSFWLLFYL